MGDVMGGQYIVSSSKRAYLGALQIIAGATLLAGCAGPYPGPDKQFAGTAGGAITGAGAGMVTGFHVGAGTGPGAAVGAGLGAVLGGVQGALQDDLENEMMKTATDSQKARARVVAHEALSEHYQRRSKVHPGRDIFPADIFFQGDSSKLSLVGMSLVDELARLNAERLPYSRLVIRSYMKSGTVVPLEGLEKDAAEMLESPSASLRTGNDFAETLSRKRAAAIVNRLVRQGIEPRRLVAEGMLLNAPLVLDPIDDPMRYNQAIEIIPVDR